MTPAPRESEMWSRDQSIFGLWVRFVLLSLLLLWPLLSTWWKYIACLPALRSDHSHLLIPELSINSFCLADGCTIWALPGAYWDGYLIFLLPQSFAAEIPQLRAHCHPVVYLYQQTALRCFPLLLLGEYNNFSVFLFLSLLSLTKKDIVKINHLGQGESIDSANSADAPSESKGERDKIDRNFRGWLCDFLHLCSRNKLPRFFPPVQLLWPLGPATLLQISLTLPLLCAAGVLWVFLPNCTYHNVGVTHRIMHTHQTGISPRAENYKVCCAVSVPVSQIRSWHKAGVNDC